MGTPKTTTAKDCERHRDYETTQACSQRKCMNLCFSANCNKGVNNARDNWGWTPLIRAANENNVYVARRLLANSANVDSASNDGLTALHRAAYMNSKNVAKILIAHSANLYVVAV